MPNFWARPLEVGPDVDFNLYSETALGFALKRGNLQLGARLKLLSGIANLSSDKTDATLTTDPEYYQLDIATDYRINAAGLIALDGLADDNSFDLQFNGEEMSVGEWFSQNLSVGLDLGANMTLWDDKLRVSASLIDLGKIKWKNNARNYHSSGHYRLEGVDLGESIREDDVSFDQTLDTLSTIFDFAETQKSYTTFLPAKVYLGAQYKAHRLVSAGLLLFFERYRKQAYPGLALDLTAHLGKMLDFGLTGSQVYGSSNLGMHLALKLGPVRLLVASDNVLALANPFDHKMTSGRLGLNLAFE